MSGKVFPLQGEQRAAVEPEECVWLSASAGTGKTQVLSARVLRLLLQPENAPAQILCLTFTKSGAAEMAVRVNEVLARWVRLDDTRLGKELDHLGARNTPETRARARTLFASVLDSPGGGLRIDTIHAFAQWLLSAFPQEADIQPGSRAMEDRDRDLLSRQVLADMLEDAECEGDHATRDALAQLSIDKGPDAVLGWLMKCAAANHLWWGDGSWQPPMRSRMCKVLGLESDASAEDAARFCTDEEFNVVALRRCRDIFADWSAATGQKGAAVIDDWLAADPGERLVSLDSFFGTIMTKGGEPLANVAKRDASYAGQLQLVLASIQRALDFRALVELADWLAPLLEVGRKFALRWDEAKAREGFVDFDDQIRKAADLLTRKDMAAWIRFKLDRQFDHILIDEAQDTNAEQWQIIFALIDDFFSGEGARGDKLRTIFTVGDYKQAIFRFQGTSPENFEAAKERVRLAMDAAADNAERLRANLPARRLREYGLDRSFRTASPVLEFVDRAIGSLGWRSLGLKQQPTDHIGEERPGQVTLWNYVTSDGESEEGEEAEQENWLARHDRAMADKIAQQVKQWMDEGYPLAKPVPARNATPGDIMILVRKRKELASLIVARLYAVGVPVAGVDRLRLGNPLAVKDLMAALRFAAQPLDDLALANLLVSPLIGWSQQDLLEYGYRGDKIRLWDHLRNSEAPRAAETADRLRDLLRLADYEPVQALLHWILVGPWGGRRKLVERLGNEANDPIDELLNAAQAYAAAHTASLQGFIQWFDAGDGELKREAGQASDLVRVMTVHGAKGLQAPIVILADAAGKPGDRPEFGLVEQPIGGGERRIPLPGLSKERVVGPLAEARDAAAAAELEEHWRLLYVAMTRAEEALFIGGSLGPREAGKGPHEDSWFARLLPVFGGEALADERWGARWEWGERPSPLVKKPDKITRERSVEPLPAWARIPIGPEPRPPRPLAPSGTGEDRSPDPPLPPEALASAARRGVLIHALLERLPMVDEQNRQARATSWLEKQAPELSDQDRNELLDSALAVIELPEFAALFGPDALAEVPLAATVDGQVIAGTADRLLVTADEVRVVDFKTARRPPLSLEDIPQSTVRQMAAYVAALEAIYPGRPVRAAVLYTQTPELFALPAALIESAKARLSTGEESFARPDVE
ncbi:double-strand break repair helicase AddA [Parerythrobacter lacustris]|uniref:DNA 3'-5' helicase n=1 Tax=Parerythrobacter lacustris TaxID=2969984 RepID=A0ABT1XQW4_9SPHN|nr:double-strand break repair helicase AddA [Parerythrobacter lacustris]